MAENAIIPERRRKAPFLFSFSLRGEGVLPANHWFAHA